MKITEKDRMEKIQQLINKVKKNQMFYFDCHRLTLA